MRLSKDLRKMPSNYYQYYKSHGICVTCGQENAKPGHVRCWRCLLTHADHEADYRSQMSEEQKAAKLASRREKGAIIRAKRRESGLCPNCGKERENPQYVLCEKCRKSARQSQMKMARKRGVIPMDMRGDGAFCAVCAKPVEVEGSKLCNRCAENCAVNIQKARAAQGSNGNHVWRKLERARVAINRQYIGAINDTEF